VLRLIGGVQQVSAVKVVGVFVRFSCATSIWQNHFLLLWVVLRYLLSDYRFGEIKILSILWNLKAKPKRGWLKWVRYTLFLLDCWFKFFY
jgi:hypothetical protein